jgi:flagellar protein FlaG
MDVGMTGAVGSVYVREAVMRDSSQGRREVRQERPRPEQSDIPKADLHANLDTLEKTYLAFNRRLKFSVVEDTNLVIVKVIDTDTDKVIKEIPPKEIQDLVSRIEKAIGVFVDEMI